MCNVLSFTFLLYTCTVSIAVKYENHGKYCCFGDCKDKFQIRHKMENDFVIDC